jgi:glycosyltransferase involved in cell wall biosynthesis
MAILSTFPCSNSNPLVSVIIPTHNRDQLVGRAVNSVLRQSYRKVEVIVVNDGSKDSTDEVLRQIDDGRIKVILLQGGRRGASAARNRGIEAATGQYIAFLDDDDEWLPEKLSNQLNKIDQKDIILCGALLKSNGNRDHHYKKQTIDLDDLKGGYCFGGGTSTIFAKTSVMKENRFDEGLWCDQDWDFLIRLAGKYNIGYMSNPLVVYNDGRHSRISNRIFDISREGIEKRFGALRKHADKLGVVWVSIYILRKFFLDYKAYLERCRGRYIHVRRFRVTSILVAYIWGWWHCVRRTRNIGKIDNCYDRNDRSDRMSL